MFECSRCRLSLSVQIWACTVRSERETHSGLGEGSLKTVFCYCHSCNLQRCYSTAKLVCVWHGRCASNVRQIFTSGALYLSHTLVAINAERATKRTNRALFIEPMPLLKSQHVVHLVIPQLTFPVSPLNFAINLSPKRRTRIHTPSSHRLSIPPLLRAVLPLRRSRPHGRQT